jgi:hypothetical protein
MMGILDMACAIRPKMMSSHSISLEADGRQNEPFDRPDFRFSGQATGVLFLAARSLIWH